MIRVVGLLALFVVPRIAAAQAQSMEEPYRVVVHSRTPHTQLEILDEANQVLAKCVERCDVSLRAGTYVVRQHYTDSGGPRHTEIKVERSGQFEIENANDTLAALGVIATVAGGVLLMTGGALLVAGTCIDNCSDSTPQEQEQRRNYTAAGAATLIGGVVLIPMGLLTFIPNISSKAHFRPFDDVKMGVAPEPGGAWLSLTGRF